MCRKSRITRPAARLAGYTGPKGQQATHELTIGFSESELARENGAAVSTKTELRQLRANKWMGAQCLFWMFSVLFQAGGRNVLYGTQLKTNSIGLL